MKILFLCMANSVRSQLAEAIARHLLGPNCQVQSAGEFSSSVHPMVGQVLSEKGIGLTNQWSKAVSEIEPSSVDTIVTLCQDEVAPVSFARCRQLHWVLPDPSAPEFRGMESIDIFRTLRDDIEKRIIIHFLH